MPREPQRIRASGEFAAEALAADAKVAAAGPKGRQLERFPAIRETRGIELAPRTPPRHEQTPHGHVP